MWWLAAEAFCKAASLYSKSGRKFSAANSYVETARCFKKCNIDNFLSGGREQE
jgi:hypothetical protein